MSDNNIAKKHFQEGMTEFIGHNFDKSVDALSRAIELKPDFKLARMSRGAAYLKMDKADGAVADFNKVIELDPDYSKAFHLRGLAREKSGDDKTALHDFNKAIELDPEYGAAYYSRAALHSKMGNHDLATEDIEMATHLTEVNIETFANENNIWRSQHMKLEEMGVADSMDR